MYVSYVSLNDIKSLKRINQNSYNKIISVIKIRNANYRPIYQLFILWIFHDYRLLESYSYSMDFEVK